MISDDSTIEIDRHDFAAMLKAANGDFKKVRVPSAPSGHPFAEELIARDEHSRITTDVIKAAMALAQRDVDLGLVTVEQIESIPRTRFAPVERKKIAEALSAQGMSNRAIAKVTGADERTIRRDLNAANAAEGAANAAPDERQDEGNGAAMTSAADDWRVHWQDMPAFSMNDAGPHRKINVLFDSDEAVEAFAKLINQTVTAKTKSVWFPPKPKQSRKDFMYHNTVPDPNIDGTPYFEPTSARTECEAEEVPTTITPRWELEERVAELEAEIEAERETALARKRELQSKVDELRARIAELEGGEAPQAKQLFERAGQQRLPFEWEIGADAACARRR